MSVAKTDDRKKKQFTTKLQQMRVPDARTYTKKSNDMEIPLIIEGILMCKTEETMT